MELSDLSKIFKALSNEQRLKLFKLIYHWQQAACDDGEDIQCCKGVDKTFSMACDCLDISKSTISHHFKELQNAGLITCSRKGQSFTCKVNSDVINEIKNFI